MADDSDTHIHLGGLRAPDFALPEVPTTMAAAVGCSTHRSSELPHFRGRATA